MYVDLVEAEWGGCRRALTDESDSEGIKRPCIWGGPRGSNIIQLSESIRSTTGQFWQHKKGNHFLSKREVDPNGLVDKMPCKETAVSML